MESSTARDPDRPDLSVWTADECAKYNLCLGEECSSSTALLACCSIDPDRPDLSVWTADECAKYYLCLGEECSSSTALLACCSIDPDRPDLSVWTADECAKYYLCLDEKCSSSTALLACCSIDPDRPDLSVWTADECAKYYLCLDEEVFEFHCSPGLLFDVNRQLLPTNYQPSIFISETIIARPLLDMADCANDTHIGCSDGSCIPAEYFLACQLPECYCSENGTSIPGNLEPTQHILPPSRTNPNGCPVKATFFISHPYTNYRHVQKLWNDGHEIAVNSI
ncbi:Uncharacterized protein OBRU01_20493, partial [Operophtera brumata]